MSKDYTHIGFSLLRIIDARVSDLFDILKKQPDYSEDDNPFVLKFESRGGENAPPGALTLKEHDIIHFLCGINFVPFGTKNLRKDSERFLTGFQFGADPNFTDDHAQQFIDSVNNPDNQAAEDYKFSERGINLYFLGITLGRDWHKATGLNLQSIAESALMDNPRLIDLYKKFWGSAETQGIQEIQMKILSQLNQTRDDVPESFLPANYLWTSEQGRSKTYAKLFALRFETPHAERSSPLWVDPEHQERRRPDPDRLPQHQP